MGAGRVGREPRRLSASTGHTHRSGHTGQVNTVAFTPDGHRLSTGGADFTVRPWDVPQPRGPRQTQTLTTHTDAVDAVAFGPDGRTPSTGSEDWTSLLRDPDIARVASRICATVSPTTTRAEWRQHSPRWAYRPPCGS